MQCVQFFEIQWKFLVESAAFSFEHPHKNVIRNVCRRSNGPTNLFPDADKPVPQKGRKFVTL